MLLLLLAACDVTPEKRDTSSGDSGGAPDTDTATDTAPPDTGPDDTGPDDTGPDDTGPTGDPMGAHDWTGVFGVSPDLRISACGATVRAGEVYLAPGPDLDGDGLAELAVGVPGYDDTAYSQGTVFLVRGADLAAGEASVFDAWARVVAPIAEQSAYFGERVEWVGDRDGDGVDDLLAWRGGHFEQAWVVSGASLLSGGEVAVASDRLEDELRVERWDDVDGDGREDWVFGVPDWLHVSETGDWGALLVVSDADFGAASMPTATREVLAADDADAGARLLVLDADLDGDGIREVGTNLEEDFVVLSSAGLLGAAATLDEAVLLRFSEMETPYLEPIALGDVDAGGVDDFVFLGDGDLCVARGEAPEELACVRNAEAETPAAAAQGDDLDGDGVGELWVQLADGLVAWDAAALIAGERVERARIDIAGSTFTSLATDGAGAVWTSPYVYDGVPSTAAWRFPQVDGLTEGDADARLLGGHSGGDPGDPVWHDLTGDGVADLSFLGERLHVFDGTGLAAGGERTMCDADVVVDFGALQDAAWVDDADGDGVPELFYRTSGEARQYGVTSGTSVLAGNMGPDIGAWSSYARFEPLGCDLTGDGRGDFVTEDDEVHSLYDAAVLTAGDVDAALIGRVEAYGIHCLSDVDGDARDELMLTVLHEDWRLLLGSQLDPAVTLLPADGWGAFVDDGARAWSTPVDVGEDGTGERVFLVTDEVDDDAWSEYALCRVRAADLAAGGTFDLATSPVACGEPWMSRLGAATAAYAVGDTRIDLLVAAADLDWSWGLYAIDDAGTDQPRALAAGLAGAGGFGADVLGTGAPASWALFAPENERTSFEAVFARFP